MPKHAQDIFAVCAIRVSSEVKAEVFDRISESERAPKIVLYIWRAFWRDGGVGEGVGGC